MNITYDNLDQLVREAQELRRQGKIKSRIESSNGPAEDYGKGQYTGD